MTTNLIIQYSLVGMILLAASVWIVWQLIKIRRRGPKSCCGCSLSQTCKKTLPKNKERECHTGNSSKI
ncbi:MAG: FeoB-associated Cys-rich membrane protein [Muribaculaceae bacterium]|nr:FeoB-associated Cys-rich membrane protein [Muribaculaceae bacterium]